MAFKIEDLLLMGFGGVVGNKMARKQKAKGNEMAPWLISGGAAFGATKTRGMAQKALTGASVGAGIVALEPHVGGFLGDGAEAGDMARLEGLRDELVRLSGEVDGAAGVYDDGYSADNVVNLYD